MKATTAPLRQGIYLPPIGTYGDANLLVELAVQSGVTNGPSRTLEVAAATAAKVIQASASGAGGS